jgi:hypothetical protein
VLCQIEHFQSTFGEHLIENGSPGQPACVRTGVEIILVSRGAARSPADCFIDCLSQSMKLYIVNYLTCPC